MKCTQCRKEVTDESKGSFVNIDGDWVCSDACNTAYIKERDHFFNHIVHSEEATTRWLLSK